MQCIFSLFFVIGFIGSPYQAHAAGPFHIKMGAAYILAPEDPGSVSGTEASAEFIKLLTEYNAIIQEMETAITSDKKISLQKRASTLERLLIKQSLQDRRVALASGTSKAEISSAKRYNSFSPLLSTAAAEKNGVLFAHEKGLLGKDVKIGVIEGVNALPASSPLQKRIIPLETDRKLRSSDPYHAEGVVSIILQIAPKAQIHLIDRGDVTAVAETLSEKGTASQAWFSPMPVIYNWSGSAAVSREYEEHFMPLYKDFLKEALLNRKGILIKALPNSKGSSFAPKDEDELFNATLFPEIADHTILAGNLNALLDSPDSGVTPLTPLHEQRFLCAMGDNILVSQDVRLSKESGTSYAAPTISGIAALLKGAYPHFSLQEIGDILLESTQTTFWVNLYGNSRFPRFIYNSEEFKESGLPSILPPPEVKGEYEPGIKVIPFSSKTFGRGVVNVGRAIVYADLKTAHPDFTKDQLKPLFQKAIYDKQNQAASHIQTLWRQKKAKK